ncbi:MAG: sigma-70 family RNA polymerase sigma factor [Planctomycetota bacterium]
MDTDSLEFVTSGRASDDAVAFDVTLDQHLRSLARRLVLDDSAADDVVQEVWCVASRAEGVARPEPWLKVLTRRFARKRRLADRRRVEVERAAARPEATMGAGRAGTEMVADAEREEWLEALQTALVALQGRQGDVLRLRYREGLRLREIAERLGVPLGTIKSDHAVALRWLRRSLDARAQSRARQLAQQRAQQRDQQRPGAERSWAIALAPWAFELADVGRDPIPARPAPLTPPTHTWWSGLVAWPLAIGAAAWVILGLAPGAGRGDKVERQAALDLHPALDDVVVSARAALADGSATGPLDPGSASTSSASRVTAAELSSSESSAAAFEPADVGRIRVAVTAHGAPLTEGTVLASGRDQGELDRGLLDESGHVTLTVDRSALYAPRRANGAPVVALGVGGVGRAVTHVHFVEVPSEREGAVEVALELPYDELVLEGRAATADGVPVAGARVWFNAGAYGTQEVAPGHWRQRRVEEAHTDVAGGFRGERLVPGRVEVAVCAEGFLTRTVSLDVPTAGRHVLPEPIVLERAMSVAGTIVDAEGQPVEGAQVWAQSLDGVATRSAAYSDAYGRFELGSLPAAEDVLWARSGRGGAVLVGRRSVQPSADGHARVTVVVEERYLGRVRLVDDQGAPLAGWSVEVRTASQKLAPSEQGPTQHPTHARFSDRVQVDARGEALLARDPGGAVSLELYDTGTDRFEARMPVEVRGVDGPWGGVLELVVAGANAPRCSLVGRVVAADGGAPGPAKLLLFAPKSHCSARIDVDPEGRFQVDGVPAGEYALLGSTPGDQHFGLMIGVIQPGSVTHFGELRLPTELGVAADSAAPLAR